ncbi:hypothetical protein [Actinomadura sp. DC4]|uniref:hypothetical protein n=1 Tax=Actinomadura sp. DC4 TaxID=3055069 RepID=UPI0025AFB9FC|nr:hypothetical protein [Actinomadura sp. DC4]MDN3351972.1 hypothetical protein [Actinomadura sp. DC4]
MSVAHVLWILNVPLVLFAVVLGSDTMFLRRRRARETRQHFLEEAEGYLSELPETGPMLDAWAAVIGQAIVSADMNNAQIWAICALECADDRAVADLRELVTRDVNIMNKFAALVDEGLVRPIDVARQYPGRHAALLNHLALVAPFIWYVSILGGRGRWGYRMLRLKTIFEQLRVVSSRRHLRAPLEIEVGGIHFLALESVTAAERVLGWVRLQMRSPTINVRSKLAQARERVAISVKLMEAGVDTDRGDGPGRAVDW